MGSEVSNPDEELPGWRLELNVPNWLAWMFGEGDQVDGSSDPQKKELEKRFESVGWGLLFLLVGAVSMPNGTAEYAAVAGIGAALVLLNVARVALHMEIAWFGATLGASLLIAGVGALAGFHMDAFVLFFAIGGLVTILAAIARPSRKADPRLTTEP
jgi:hypothetical protein